MSANNLPNFTINCLALPAAIIGGIQGVIWLILSLISILYYNNAIEPSATLDTNSYGYVIYQLYLESDSTTDYEIDSKSFNIFMYLYMVLSFVWLIISVALLWATLRKKWNNVLKVLVCWSTITIIISILDITMMSLLAADLHKAQTSSTVPAVSTTTDSSPFSSSPNPTLSTSTAISPTNPTTSSTTHNPPTTTSNMPTTYYSSTVTIPTTSTISTTSTPITTTLKPTTITTSIPTTSHSPTTSTTTSHTPTNSTTTSHSPTTSATTSHTLTTPTTTSHSPTTPTTTNHTPTNSTTTSHTPTNSTTTSHSPTNSTTTSHTPTNSTTTSHTPTNSTTTSPSPTTPTTTNHTPTNSTTTSHSPTTSTTPSHTPTTPTTTSHTLTTLTTTSHSPTTPTTTNHTPTNSTTTSHTPTNSTTTSHTPTNSTTASPKPTAKTVTVSMATSTITTSNPPTAHTINITTTTSPLTTSQNTTANTISSTSTETTSSTHYIPTNTPSSTTLIISETRNSRRGYANYNFGEAKTSNLITHYTTLSLNMHYPLIINPNASIIANRAMDSQTVCTAIAIVMSLAARGYVLLILNLTIAIILLAITLHTKRQNTRPTMRRTIINAYANGLSSVYDQVEIDKSFQNEGFQSDEYIFGLRSNDNNANGKNPLSNSNRSSIINAQTSSYPFEKVEPLRLPSVQASRLAKIGKAGEGKNSPPRRVPSPTVPTTFNGYPYIPEPDYTPPPSPTFQPKSVLRPKSNYEF